MRKTRALAVTAFTAVMLAFPVAGHAATDTYGDYSMMFTTSAGQYASGGANAGQWTWKPQSATVSDISWGDPTAWPPKYAERFMHVGDWVEIDGYSGGQGEPVSQVQRVTSEKIGDANCQNMTAIPSDGGRQHYAKWTIPAQGYCLDAVGTIKSPANGTVVNFRHKQVWGAPADCSNAYFSGQRCITQHEQWWDDNQHAYGLQIDRTQYIARGKGMAFAINATVPQNWNADGQNYWTY
jgi:hypothetical protein